MMKHETLVTPTVAELQQKHSEIINHQFHQIKNIQADLDDVNKQLYAIRIIQPRMRSLKMRNELSNRQQKLIEIRSRLHENLAILYMASLQPLLAIAKILETDKPSEHETPQQQTAPQRQITNEELQAMYTKYVD